MNLEDARYALEETLTASNNVVGHLERLQSRMSDIFPLDADTFSGWGDSEREQLHAFMHLFEQLHEIIGRKLFRGILVVQLEETWSLSARDMHERLEQLGTIHSASEWGVLCEVKNTLIHEYPTNALKQANSANLAWNALDRLISVHRHLTSYVQKRNLI
jgi:hypothetical protein